MSYTSASFMRPPPTDPRTSTNDPSQDDDPAEQDPDQHPPWRRERRVLVREKPPATWTLFCVFVDRVEAVGARDGLVVFLVILGRLRIIEFVLVVQVVKSHGTILAARTPSRIS